MVDFCAEGFCRTFDEDLCTAKNMCADGYVAWLNCRGCAAVHLVNKDGYRVQWDNELRTYLPAKLKGDWICDMNDLDF